MTFARLSDDFDSKIQYHRLSTSAVFLHVRCLQICISVESDGLISVATVRELLQTRNIRNRDAVIAELIASGEWWWIDDEHLQMDWTHQETAEQAALKNKQNSKRQADWVTRNLKCAGGDHSMCEGTNRECQRNKKRVTNAVPLHSTPSHSTPQSGVKDERAAAPGSASPQLPAPGGASVDPVLPSDGDENRATEEARADEPVTERPRRKSKRVLRFEC